MRANSSIFYKKPVCYSICREKWVIVIENRCFVNIFVIKCCCLFVFERKMLLLHRINENERFAEMQWQRMPKNIKVNLFVTHHMPT